MTKLIRQAGGAVYLSPEAQDLGHGWAKRLAFIPHKPSTAAELDFAGVAGQGAIVVASIEGPADWLSDDWVSTIAKPADSHLVYLVRKAGQSTQITGNLRCAPKGQDWELLKRAEIQCAFSGQLVVVQQGTVLAYRPAATRLLFENASDLPSLGGFELHGARDPKLSGLGLDLAWPGGLVLSADTDILVSRYYGASALGQNFTRLKQTFLGTYEAENFGFPLVVALESETRMSLGVVLDPAEPQLTAPLSATAVSRLWLKELRDGAMLLDTIPLNYFSAIGARLTARAADVAKSLAFHFVPRLSSMDQGFAYSGAALVPHGSLPVSSGSALLGAGHLERVGEFNTLSFDAFAPAAGLDAHLRNEENLSVGRVDPQLPQEHFLSGRAVVAATSFMKTAANAAPQTSGISFSPDGMPLYQRGEFGKLPYMPLVCDVPAAMPVGTVDIEHAGKSLQDAASFEGAVISPHRMYLLGQARQRDIEVAMSRPGIHALADVVGSTPQGFKVIQDSAGLWKEIEFAAGGGWKLVLDLGTNLTMRRAIHEVFSRKDIFIVIGKMPMPIGSGTAPNLRLDYSASGWTFSTTVGLTEPATSHSAANPPPSPLAVIKFGRGSVQDLLKDTALWSGKDLFIGDAGKVDQARAQLVDHLQALEADLAADLAANKDARKPFSAPFVSPGVEGKDIGKLKNPAWNGFSAFSLSMLQGGNSPFPPDLQPILDGYRSLLTALVLCADLRPAASENVSEIAALIRYATPAQDQPGDSQDPDCSGGFNLQLLRVLLKSGGVDNFECKLGFKLSKFLGQAINGLAGNASLIGTYDRRNDTSPPTDVYSFSMQGNYEKTFPNFPVKRMQITKIGYERVESASGPAKGQLLLQGQIDLALSELGADGLSFDRLGLSFDAKDRGFSFAPGMITLNFDPNKFSKLLKSFPFKLKSFMTGRMSFGKFANLEQFGFQRLGFGGSPVFSEFAYGLTFDLDLGSLGAIARKLEAFGAQLFVGWKIDAGLTLPALGLKLNGNRGGPLEISAFDVITLKADGYAFGKLDASVSGGQDVYYLNAQNVRIKLLNLEFPDAVAKQHLYFYYPTANPGGVGFLYGRTAPGTDLALLGIGQRTSVGGLFDAQTVEEGMDKVETALVNVDEHNLPLKSSAGVVYKPDVNWFLALSAKVFGLAHVDLLMADPRIYGARITLPAAEWGLGKDWFIDMLYRRLDDKTGIFSMEVPPPIAMLDLGAVQVILPTIRGEFGSPGNHLLVDLGFPEKKSLANWARTGKVVAGIFGGEGGAYFGRIAPGAFPVKLTPAYDRNYEFKDSSIFTAGIAASFGLMRYFAAGPVTGHASLAGFFTAEGAIATIRLKSGSTALQPSPPSQFISLAGAFGIKGSVEACADFGLIKVAVGFSIVVMFSLSYQTWHGIEMETSVTVNAYARLVIARIKIPFDGRLEIAIEFSFSFQTKVSVQLSADDPNLGLVFAPRTPLVETGLAAHRSRALSLLGAMATQWTWPAPTPAVLGLASRLPFPSWFMAARSVEESRLPGPGNPVAVLMPFLAIGENPQYTSDEDSVSALVNVLTRWMLLQISGTTTFKPGARVSMSALLAAHMSFQPEGKDGTPQVVPVQGADSARTYNQSVSPEGALTALRPAFEKLDFAQLTELYRTCLDAQVLVPASKNGQTRIPKAVPYPLPPAFEIFVSANPGNANNKWECPAGTGIDLSAHRPLKESQVVELRNQLNKYYATLLVEDTVAAARDAAPLSMQSWLFLYWHQILCTELMRGIVSACEKRIQAKPGLADFSLAELLDEVMRGGNGSVGWRAAGTASRLYGSGLRFEITEAGGAKVQRGMYELAGLTLREVPHGPNDSVFAGLRTLAQPPAWFAIGADRSQDCMHGGVLKRAIALEVTEAFVSAPFPQIQFQGDVRDKGYTLEARQFAVSQSLSIGQYTKVGVFPPTLVARLRGQGGPGEIEWTFGKPEPLSGSSVYSGLPLRTQCAVHIQLQGSIVGVSSGTALIALRPLAPAERETLAKLMGDQLVNTEIGLRLAADAKSRPDFFEDANALLPSVKIFRTNVTREENPPKSRLIQSTDPQKYEGQGAEGIRNVLRAWTLTAASSCFLSADFAKVLPSAKAGSEVDLLLLYFPSRQTPLFTTQSANAVVYYQAAPESLLMGSKLYDKEKVPRSNADAIVVEATRKAPGQALVELPAQMRDLFRGESVLTVDELKRRASAGGQVHHSAAAKLQPDLKLLAESVEPWANHFDMLAYSVYVDGVKVVDETKVIPLLSNTAVGSGQAPLAQGDSRYFGHVAARLLETSGNPYALVGKSIKVFGHLRDHFGQHAPMQPVALLDRVEEYRDEISSADSWDHLGASLSVEGGNPKLVVSAALAACHADAARADLMRRKFSLLKMQLSDPNLHVDLVWAYGTGREVAVPNSQLVTLIDALLKSLATKPRAEEAVFKLPLGNWPGLPAAWCALPFGAELRITRKVATFTLQTASSYLYPSSMSGSGVEGQPELTDFFVPMLKTYTDALLAVGDPGPGFGRYWLVNKLAVNHKLDKPSAGFHAMPPFSNRLVSAGEWVDRDVDLALRESFEKLDATLQDQALMRFSNSIPSLLKLKKTASVVCGKRTTTILKSASGTPDAAQRALEDAVAAKAGDAYRIASVLAFKMAEIDAGKTVCVMKIAGELSLKDPSKSAGDSREGLGVSTIGIVRAGEDLQMPVVVWDKALQAGTVPVPALEFKPLQLQIDLTKVAGMRLQQAEASGDNRIPYREPVGHWLNLLELPGSTPATLVLSSFKAPSPRREAVATPKGIVHSSSPSKDKPASLRAAKDWTYTASFGLPHGATFDPSVDFLRCQIDYPLYGPSALTVPFQDPAGDLLKASIAFNQAAAAVVFTTADGSPEQAGDLSVAAGKLEAALSRLATPLVAAGVKLSDRVALIPDLKSGGWKQESEPGNSCKSIVALVAPKARNLFTVTASNLDVCAFPSASASLQVNRNEELTFGYGSELRQAVNDQFVYRTPRVGFSDAVFASLELEAVLPAGTVGLPVVQWVPSVYDELLKQLHALPPGQQNIMSVQCRLGWNVSGISRLRGDAVEPVAVTMVSVTASESNHVADIVKQEVQRWQKELGVTVVDTSGYWSLDLAVFLQTYGASGQAGAKRVANFRKLKLPGQTAVRRQVKDAS